MWLNRVTYLLTYLYVIYHWSSSALYSARMRNTYVKQDCVQVLHSIQHVRKMPMINKVASSFAPYSALTETHMSRKIDFKSRTLFDTHRTCMSSKIASSRALYSTRTENAHVERDWLQHWLVLYSARKKNVHVRYYLGVWRLLEAYIYNSNSL